MRPAFLIYKPEAATLSNEFTSGDKTFFEELVASGKRPILLTRKHMEMSYLETLEYGRAKQWGGRDADLLSRLTIRKMLGKEFAYGHGLWV
jgi:hypothetical protein